MNYRGQGKLLDSDIRKLLTTKMNGETFSKRWTPELYVIVKQLFYDKLYELMRDRSIETEEKEKGYSTLSNKVSMFCSAFV